MNTKQGVKEALKVKHEHVYREAKSGIFIGCCGRFKHKEGGEVIVEQTADVSK